MPSILIPKATKPLDATVVVPGSKSVTNRALVMAALSQGRSVLRNALFAEDTRVMVDGLRALGFDVRDDESSSTLTVDGASGRIPNADAEVFCGNSGTTSRFLTALCGLGFGSYEIDGHRRMRERPMRPLTDALQRLGVRIEFLEVDGHLPLRIHAEGLRGGHVRIKGGESSQFFSALLMVAAGAGNDVFVEAAGPVPSRPYVTMTVAMMREFGVDVIEAGLSKGGGEPRWIVPAPQSYSAREYWIEPDASAASYFFAAAAAAGGRVTVRGMGRNLLQGDVAFLNVLERMGCGTEAGSEGISVLRSPDLPLRGIDVDLSDMPDVAPTLACLAMVAGGNTRMTGLGTLRIKESDRLGALAHELQRLGAEAAVSADALIIRPGELRVPCALNTYDDHRLAMSFAVLGLAVDGITVNDPECVAKTYPHFFRDFLRLTTGAR